MNMESDLSPWSVVPRLSGAHVRLEPLGLAHVDGLRAAVLPDRLWELWYTTIPGPEEAQGYVETALAQKARGEALPFAVLDGAGEVVGSTRFYQLDPRVPRLCIGYTWYATRVQRTGLNTQAKLLLLTHAFEAMGCAAVTFETSWFNHASRTAIARLGARQDGVLRNHLRHRDGTLRDTVVFSITQAEWPAVKQHLQMKLARHG
jgi:RimJ/RimL family protein N-acetyltransferase